MLRLSFLVPVIAFGMALAGCSKKEQSSPDTTAANAPAPAATADESAASQPAAEVATDEEPTIRFSIPGSSPAPSAGTTGLTKPAPTLSQTAASSSTSRPTVTPARTEGQQGAQPPEFVVYFPPFYPLSMRMEGIEGRIDLGLSISASGDVADVEVLQATAPQFRDYAIAAAREWKFIPARIDGKAVPINIKLPVPFVSEFGSGQLSPYSPLAQLTYIDGTYYTTGKDGRLKPADVEVTPILRAQPAFSRPETETKPLRVTLRFTVTDQGQVLKPEVTEPSGTPFDQAALTAVKYWQFLPQIRGGKARQSTVTLPLVYGTGDKSAQTR